MIRPGHYYIYKDSRTEIPNPILRPSPKQHRTTPAPLECTNAAEKKAKSGGLEIWVRIFTVACHCLNHDTASKIRKIGEEDER